MEETPIDKPIEEKQIIKMKKSTLWQILTAVFAVLFVISLFTGGFGITGDVTTAETPAGGAVSAIIINDARCEECDTTGLVGQLQSMIPGLELEELDYSEDKGKELYDELELEFLPAVLLDPAVKNEPAYAQMQQFIQPKGEYLSLAIGARHDPSKEICNNEVDDTGNDLIDCEDPDCENQLICRKEIPNKLDLFVMSQCPFGTKALDAMKPILENFPDLEFNIWMIATEGENGTFNSLHGQPEVDENIRELCAIAHYPKQNRYMNYIYCRNKDIQSEDWEPCVEEAKMSVETMKECFEGEEGAELLSENIKLGNELGISASPTWLANNNYKFSGIDSAVVQQQYCSVNEDAEGCDAEINASSTIPSGTC